MSSGMTTALALLLALAACSRQPLPGDRSGGNAAAPSAANVVIAPAMAPPAIADIADAAAEADSETAEADETPAPAPAEGCAGEIGLSAAQRLAGQCRDVSPATRPPCNVANSCAMIRDEIVRGCEMLGADAPDHCAG